MDQITDLRFDSRELSERGFRFAKVPAALLLSRPEDAGIDIHPADFSDMLARYGIDMIASRIENETSVFYNRWGQFIYKEPRGKFAGYPYPGYAMVYPYPRTVSSYSSGPSLYPPVGRVGGWGWHR